jgi:RHS repeat-associated protein
MDKKTLGVRALLVGLRSLSAASLALALATCGVRGHSGAGDPSPNTGPAMSGEVQRSSALATRPTTGVPPRATTAVVGELPGSGWVGHDGAYHYRIPIEVPAGRAGMAPSLALTYSSQGGNGPVGVGFSIEGASSITRCERVAAAGGERDRIRFQTFDDVYCLDGQRLVLVSGGGGSLGDTYRTELDNFTRVTISGTNGTQITKWTAQTKDGRNLSYELLAETVGTTGTEPWTQRQLVNADGSPNGAPKTVELVWPLTKQIDRSGNGIRYGYVRSSGATNDGGGDVPLLSQIDYTTCETTPCDFADSVRPRRVVLDYETRPVEDRLERWVNGVVVRTNVRLRSIHTQVRDDNQSWWPQRYYNLAYWTDAQDPNNHRVTKRGLLQSVQLCEGTPVGGSQTVCLIPTTFTWQSRAQHKVLSKSDETSFEYQGFVGDTTKMEVVVFDANGDGNDDVMLHEPNQAANSTSGIFGSSATYKERLLLGDGAGRFRSAVDVSWGGGACKSLTHLGMSQPVDLDGNGKTELVIECGNYGVLAWNPGGGTLAEVSVPGITELVQPAAQLANGYRGQEGYLKFADLTSDGLPDLLTAGPSADGTEAFGGWWKQTAQVASLTPTWAPQISYLTKKTTGVRTAGPVLNGVKTLPQVTTVLDLDGDGHQELVQMDYNSAMRSYEDAPDTAFDIAHFYRFQDFAGNVSWTSFIDSGTGAEPNWGTATYTNGGTGQSLWYFADINGDGLKDAVYATGPGAVPANGWFMRINTGEGFLAPVALGGNPCKPTWIGSKGSDRNLLIGDLNGDGRDDLVKLSGATNLATPNWTGYAGTRDPIRVCYSNGAGFDPPVDLPLKDQAYRLFDNKDVFPLPPGGPRGTSTSPAERFLMTQLGDFNGDGIADVVDFVAGTTSGLSQGFRKPVTTVLDPTAIRGGVDLLVRVTDGRDVRQEVTYDALSAGTRARLGSTGPAGIRDTHLASAGSWPAASTQKGAAVRKLVDYGHATPGRFSTTLHLYEGARTDLTGRGFLGFNRHLTVDQATGDVTDYTFTLSTFPLKSRYYLYPTVMRPSAVQNRLPLTVISELPPPDASLAATSGVVSAPGMNVAEIYEGNPLRLEHIYQNENQRTRTNGGALVETGSYTFRELAYDDWGNLTSSLTDTVEMADPTFTAHYTRIVNTQFDNIIDAATWRLGEARREVETTRSNDPYVTSGGDVSDTRTTEFWYDAKGRLEWIVREPNTSTTTPQGTNGELMMIRNTRNNAGQVTIQRRYAPTGITCSSTSNCGAGQGCASAAAGAVNQCWDVRADSFGYDLSGTFVESFTNPLSQTHWVLYDASTSLSYLTADENGVKTVLTRDGLGRVTKSSNDTGASRSTTYARDASTPTSPYDIVRVNEASAGQGSTLLDFLGRTRYRSWSAFAGGSGVASTSFDALGNVTRSRYNSVTTTEAVLGTSATSIDQAAATGPITYQATYDRAGRMVSSSRGTSEQSAFTYPAYGKVAISDGEGLSSSTIVDAAGRVVARTQGSNEIHYRYKGDGKLASITGTGNRIERFYFDKIGRPTQWTTGVVDGSTMERLGGVSYDAFDHMNVFSRDGVVITQSYDKLDRVLTRASGTELGQKYEWDTGAVGRLKRAVNLDGNHEIVNSYDSLGRITERREKFAGGATSLSFGYQYDAVGRLYRLRYPEASGSGDVSAATHSSKAGPTVQFNYLNGQLASISEAISASSNPTLWRADSRHVLGMATAATYGDPADANRLTATWGYNPNTLRYESHAVARTTSGPAPTQAFTYFNNGKLKSRKSSGLNESYTYAGALGFLQTYHRDDGAGQKLVNATFSYGDSGMTGIDTTASTGSPDWPIDDETMTPTTPNYTYELDEHQIGSGPHRAQRYDSKGRLAEVFDRSGSCSSTNPCPSGAFCSTQGSCFTKRRDIAWNSFNLPTEIDDFGPNMTRTFAYDAFGNRVRKTQDANNQVLYLGKLYEQRNLSSAHESVYRLYGDVGLIAELVHPWGGTSRTTRTLFTDHQGSPAYSVVNGTSTQLGFFPYGKRMGAAPAQKFSQLGYTGHMQDDDLNLINMGGRIYDVAIHRFLTRDAVPDAPMQVFGTHPYAYVANDPVNRVDPTGFDSADYQGQSWECIPPGSTCSPDTVPVGTSQTPTTQTTTQQTTTQQTTTQSTTTQSGGTETQQAQTPAQQASQQAGAQVAQDHFLQSQMALANMEHLAAVPQTPFGAVIPSVDSNLPATSYHYTNFHAIGTTANGVTPERVMAALQQDPNHFFPFNVVGLDAAAGMGIKVGETYDLQNVRWYGDNGNFVKVIEATSTSFTFLSLEGHFDGPDATIRFSTFEKDGVVYLRHDGNAPFAGVFNAAIAPAGAWDIQSSNLAIEMSGAEPYCYDAMGAPQ